MSYRVGWTSEAEESLIQLWTTASVSSEISRATNEINAALADDPITAGESRDDESRVFFVLPLAVQYIFDIAGRTVTVTRCWRAGRRKP